MFSATAEYRDWPALIITIDAGLFSLFTPRFGDSNHPVPGLGVSGRLTVRESPIRVVNAFGRHSDQKSRHSLVSRTFGLYESHRRRDSLNLASVGRLGAARSK
ncbi:hypothetical protein CA13_20140 [Planctomycetes bacterium CA13]|uniref:Uncharacterized protein n=1 Tax=Novipirellula herctigrandis TaxID=2527986 RepID=A0A5C5YZT5_9BACT|nr:hypothetical protein CA13_20140 [Planctomycetes bacterium CA13]